MNGCVYIGDEGDLVDIDGREGRGLSTAIMYDAPYRNRGGGLFVRLWLLLTRIECFVSR